mgnify:CR=1 FL=1
MFTIRANINKIVMKEVLAKYSSELKKLEELLRQEVHSAIREILEVSNYILSAGGKRIRPLLLMILSKREGKVPDEAILAGCAIEYIHTATLLHDDVVDDSKMRRGKPTANTIWNNQLCVLVGDFLFAKSFSIMTNFLSQDALKVVSRACISLAEGEILQLIRSYDVDTTIEDYYRIIYGKTAALFEASCQVGAMVSNKSDPEKFGDFGREIGLAFQIKDDLLDLIGNPDKTGKPIGNDLKEGKITLPLLLLKEKNPEYKKLIRRLILEDDIEETRIKDIVELCKKEGTIEETTGIVKEHLRKALGILTGLEIDEESKRDIINIVEFLAERDY